MIISDHELALSIRAGLLGIARCFEVGGDRRQVDMAIRAELLNMASAIEKRWKIKPKKTN